MVAQAALDLIPKPPGHPIIGNLLDLQGDTPLLTWSSLRKSTGRYFGSKLPAAR
jgi:hypothetical protein